MTETEQLLGYLIGRLTAVERERNQLHQRLQQLEQSGPPEPAPAVVSLVPPNLAVQRAGLASMNSTNEPATETIATRMPPPRLSRIGYPNAAPLPAG